MLVTTTRGENPFSIMSGGIAYRPPRTIFFFISSNADDTDDAWAVLRTVFHAIPYHPAGLKVGVNAVRASGCHDLGEETLFPVRLPFGIVREDLADIIVFHGQSQQRMRRKFRDDTVGPHGAKEVMVRCSPKEYFQLWYGHLNGREFIQASHASKRIWNPA
jgi:hypothetical protein